MKAIKSPFLFIGSVIFLVTGVQAFYFSFIDNEGFAALAGAYAFLIFMGTGIVLIVEQILLNKIDPGISRIWMGESLMLLALASYLIYLDRETLLQVNPDTEWFAIIEDPDLSQQKAERSFPLDIHFRLPQDSILVINPSELESSGNFRISGNSLWDGGYQASRRSVEANSQTYRLHVYFPVSATVSDLEVQRILQKVATRLE